MTKRKIQFTKMEGAGNDFIVVDARKGIDYRRLARKVCDRTFGIGADGLLVLDRSRKADYRMRIINADGSEAEMCGNGARCMAAYIARNRSPRKKPFSMETLAGTILAGAQGEKAVVRLSDPQDYRPDIRLRVNQRPIRVHHIDTGVPHTVVFVDGLAKIDVPRIGRVIRFHRRFAPRGTNVNFVEQLDRHTVAVRTYERGVEDETKACGTGSVAAAIIAFCQAHRELKDHRGARIKVRTASGEVLEIIFDLSRGQGTNVWLKGSAKFIAAGEYYLSNGR